MAFRLPFLDRNPIRFPSTDQALTEPDGLLAAGGTLSPETLTEAYRQGIFPWYDESQPILWWCPSTRAVLTPGDLHISRTLAKDLKRGKFRITSDQAFTDVVTRCAAPRTNSPGTWIVPEMKAAYETLFRLGTAHSVECWLDGELVGGLYGVQVGGVFCGESMYSAKANASKVALATLYETLFSSGFAMIDCQIINPHLASLGAREISREAYLAILDNHRNRSISWPETWQI
ncbi:MAG: leucyl/phenylalanyl-tRNA--protein transferase [bacterium]